MTKLIKPVMIDNIIRRSSCAYYKPCLVNSKQSRVNPVTNIDRGNLKLHIGKSGKWRSYLQFEVLTADYVVKWIKRRIDSKSSPHFTIEIKSDTEVTFKVHKKVQFNQ